MKKPKVPAIPGMKPKPPKGDAPSAKPMSVPGMPNFMQRAKRPGGMKKGGAVHADAAMDRKLIRQEIAKAEKAEGEGMKRGGKVNPFGKKRAKRFF